MVVDLIRDIDMILWTTSISIMAFLGASTLYRLKYLKIEEKAVFYNILTWALFYLFTATGNTIGLLNRLWAWDIPELRAFLDLLSILFDFGGVAIKISNVENTLKIFKKRVFTFYNIFVMIFIIATWKILKSIPQIALTLLILQIIGFSILPLLYFYIFIKSRGPVRINALFILTGFIGLELALTAQAHNLVIIWLDFPTQFQSIFGIPYLWTTPIEIIVFTLLIYRGYKISM
ncbi:MAG: hypothetical protein ACTSRZ_04915 [Promethearchaeota archaeon]